MTWSQLGFGLKLTMPCSTVPYQLLAGMTELQPLVEKVAAEGNG